MLIAVPPFGQVVDFPDIDPKGLHPPEKCAGFSCAIHNPSHHMGEWQMVLRMDYGWPLIERTCKHGVGHPDPDSVDWYVRNGGSYSDGHGCDGCCEGP